MQKKIVEKGGTIANVFAENEHLYPPLVGSMVAVGEETGATPKMFEELANFYESQVNDTTKNLATIIEPILMVIIGAIVGFFAVSMITPLYSVVGNL